MVKMRDIEKKLQNKKAKLPVLQNINFYKKKITQW
jgi:hypothetical protein